MPNYIDRETLSKIMTDTHLTREQKAVLITRSARKKPNKNDTFIGVMTENAADKEKNPPRMRPMYSKPSFMRWLLRYDAEKDITSLFIESPPLSVWVSALQFVFPKKVFANIFAQAIADARDDHAEALAKQQNTLARWIEVRSHVQILTTLILYVFVNIGKRVAALWKIG